jgi:hypothetical protein
VVGGGGFSSFSSKIAFGTAGGGAAVEALNDELVAQHLEFTRQVRDLLHEKAALLETLASTQQSLKELAVAHSAAVCANFDPVMVTNPPLNCRLPLVRRGRVGGGRGAAQGG